MDHDNTADRVIRALRLATSELRPGNRVPSVRRLVSEHRASPVTVQRAIAQLAAEGLLDPRPGIGTFVASPMAAHPAVEPDTSWQEIALGANGAAGDSGIEALLSLPRPRQLTLSSGYLDPALQPTAALESALARAARRPGAWGRIPVEGLPELRAWFAAESGAGFRPSDVVVCSGGQAALGTTLRSLSSPGDIILVESPTYIGLLAAARTAGLQVLPVPADTDGVRPDLLEAALRRTGARLVYLQPLYANPHGAVLTPERRARVLATVSEAGAFVIEDDWARDLAIDREPLAPLAAADPDGHVVYLRSLTKVAAPGLRVAAIAARGIAARRLRTIRHIDDFFVSGPLQLAALELVGSAAWRRHLKQLRPALRERRDALIAAVTRELPHVRCGPSPAGGFHLWCRLPDERDDRLIAQNAAAAGVIVHPGTPAFAGDPPGPFLRLTFAGTGPAELTEGVRRLATVVT
ncbi:MAG TPA: PLP-dependent aminotransferase family protein [Solirubrobacteraceae bacterium]|nr:PLP-dependent aminotransferase family protein [Solirubrobacteraceae bacterium]